MISNLIVFSTLFFGVLFTAAYIFRSEFRARIEQPKHAFLQQLSMYDKSTGAEQHGGESESLIGKNSENNSENNSKDCNENDSNTKPVVRSK